MAVSVCACFFVVSGSQTLAPPPVFMCRRTGCYRDLCASCLPDGVAGVHSRFYKLSGFGEYH